ncbi:MAG: GerMN domain-containing protein, partial [Clostridia bacterium]|nr:GerMN domain-containing protein [Clostridia bacterium]
YTCIYAIVNSLCQAQGVNRVRFTVEGHSIESGGEIALSSPLMPNIGLVY